MADMTLAQAAEELGLSHSTLAAQVRNGRLKARKMGSVWVVSRQALDRYRQDSLGRPGRRSRGEH